MVNYLAGAGGHYFETGIGVLFGADRTSDGTIDLVGGSSTTVTIGYRRQSAKKFFRVGFTPVFQLHRVEPVVFQGVHGPQVLRKGGRPFLPVFGFSIGRTFGT
jgi:hypothetical protein